MRIQIPDLWCPDIDQDLGLKVILFIDYFDVVYTHFSNLCTIGQF